jgi:hypothetical protein
VLYFFFGHAPLEQAVGLVLERSKVPRCLSRQAVTLAQDALAKGCVLALARRGGWRKAAHLRGEQWVEGRLWERSTPSQLALTFSRHSLEFLIWITAAHPGDQHPAWLPHEKELTVGDQLLFFLAYEALRATEAGPPLRARMTFFRHGLCRLAFAGDFTSVPANRRPDFAPWTNGLGACILEALQPQLAQRWLDMELDKAHISDARRMRSVGQAQTAALEAFLTALEANRRYDLARFLLEAAARLLSARVTTAQWVGGLQNLGGRMAERQETVQAALAFLRQLERLRRWDQQGRLVGYFDEGYAASQAWLALWERWQGETLYARAADLIRQLAPF